MGYLDSSGLATLWNNIKSLVSSHTATVVLAVQSGPEIADIDGTTIYSPQAYHASQITLNSSSWNNNEITISLEGVTANNDVVVTPAPSSIVDWSSCGVYCSSQGSGTLTFSCLISPEDNLLVNILIFA